MKKKSNPGIISSFLKARTHKIRNFPETKSVNRLKNSKTAQTVDQIVSFLASKGINATAARSSHRRLFADLLATVNDKPIEICLGLRKLSPADLNYRRSITAAGGIFLVVTSAKEFEDYYNSTFKF